MQAAAGDRMRDAARKDRIKFGLSALAVSSCLLGGAAPPAAADSLASRVKVENFTRFAIDSLRKEFARGLPRAFVRELSKGKYAVFVMTDRVHFYGGGNYCVSHVGLTYPQPKGRNPRIPAGQSWGVNKPARTDELSREEWAACERDALRAALAHFARSRIAQVTKKADKYSRDEGNRAKLPPRPKYRMFYTSSASAGAAVDRAIRNAVSPRFQKAFDYRHLALVVESIAFRMDTHAVCYAVSGVSATGPDNRNPRFPAKRYGRFRLSPLGMGGDASAKSVEEACETAAVTAAVSAVMQDSWDQNGILRNIARTREPDIPLVNAARRTPAVSSRTRGAAQAKVS